MRKPWTEEAKNDAGQVVRCRTRRCGVAIHRQRSGSEKSGYSWSKAWYYPKMVNGAVERFPLGHDLTAAVRLADEIATFLSMPLHSLADAKKKYNPRALARQSQFSTIGELFRFHRKHFGVLELSARTGRRYQVCLINILRRVEAWRKGHAVVSLRIGGDAKGQEWARWMERPLTVLDAKLLEDYQTLMVDDQDSERIDEEVILTRKITCDSNIRNARSIFSREAMMLYANSDLALPDLKKFMGVTLFNAKKYFELLPALVIRGIFDDISTLKLTDLNAYRAFLVAMHIGLRREEASSLKWSWVEMINGKPQLSLHEDGEFRPKAGTGRRVIFEQWVWDELKALRGSLGETVLEGEITERYEFAFERLNKWLRDHGVTSSKPTHELRKCWVSYIAKSQGLFSAQKMAGHRDPKTTTTYYADNLLSDELLKFWKRGA